jgi:hypothetical protein
MNLFRSTTTTPITTNSINRSHLRRGFLLIQLLFICFALSPTARAVSPPPDGGYPGGNTAEGGQALFSLTTGTANTAVGFQALFRNTTGVDNVATGWHALFHNIIGEANTATGAEALFHNTAGSRNTANGFEALFSNTIGLNNTATGWRALNNNTTGFNNTATGVLALFSNTTGGSNTANGIDALDFNTTGSSNTAVGELALHENTTGNNNIALGERAGVFLTTGDDNIDIGNDGVAAEADTIRIGTQGTQTNAYMAGIFGVSVPNGLGVVVDFTGHLGTVASSERFKDEIKPMDKASEAVLALKPVTFHYKKELDPEGIPQFGLVAEEVEKVNPALVARDAKGKVYTVRYDAVNAMLLNEFLKEHRKVEQQEATIAQLKSAIAQQQKDFHTRVAKQQEEFDSKIAHQQNEIEALAAGLLRVSAQLETSKPSPQMAVNDQ